MATINQTAFCPGCEYELTGKNERSCPQCGRTLATPKNKHFATPDYLYYQFKEHQNRLNLFSEKGPTDEQNSEYGEVQEAYPKWARDCPIEDKYACLNDSLLVLKHLLYSEASAEEIKSLIGIANSIGQLAKSINDYFASGGAVYHARKIRLLYPDAGNTDGSTSPTR